MNLNNNKSGNILGFRCNLKGNIDFIGENECMIKQKIEGHLKYVSWFEKLVKSMCCIY